MPSPNRNSWSKIPFVRLFICLVGGIYLEWELKIEDRFVMIAGAVSLVATAAFSLMPVAVKFRLRFFNGLIISMLVLALGSFLVNLNDIRNETNWIGHQYSNGDFIVASLEEPLVEKPNSFKAQAKILALIKNGKAVSVVGKIILYIKKDSTSAQLQYGSQIIFNKPLQLIRNNGNPGGFDYKRYCLFQGITHQVYLTDKDVVRLPTKYKYWFRSFIFDCTEWVITTIKKFVKGDKEQGLAEALLIGYKNDLDKDLVQSYSNTGVVHVIAISGLHLGLIYALLLMLTTPLKRKKSMRWLRLVIVLISLWLFSILAGAQPSVLRSAVMFSFIALGEVLERKGSVYNTLALSAFVLLCYNPFWLWDVGFQLSYAAVLSILIFFKPIYNWFYFQNKILDFVWKLNAVTIAAQLLTLPVSIYHFHQVPTLFLFTNLVAVPLSSIILIGEILLCVLFFAMPVAKCLGAIIQWLICCMNTYIEGWEKVPFSIWNHLFISGIQAILLTAFILAICFWLMEKRKQLLWLSLVSLTGFSLLRFNSFKTAAHQKKVIVYNVPKHRAIDLIEGRTAGFLADDGMINNDYLKNFHVQPARIEGRIQSVQEIEGNCVEYLNKKILVVDSSFQLLPLKNKIHFDLLILSGNPKIFIPSLLKNISATQIIIDSSVPAWKSKRWKKDCDSLSISCHDVSEEGAYVINL